MRASKVLNRIFCLTAVFLGANGQSLVKHVVHIGVDGLRPDCMNSAPGGNPNIMNRIAAQGTYTLTKALTVIETVSAAGWTSTLCAMESIKTGVLNNSWTPPWQGNKQQITPVTGNDQPFPCVYQTIKDQRPSTNISAWYSWNWLQYLHNNMVPGSVDKEYFCPDNATVCDPRIASSASEHLRQVLTSSQSSYHFVYFFDVDEQGHAQGWCSPGWLNTVATTDGYIGQILDAIEDTNMQDETLVILSSDHGADADNHGRRNDNCIHIPIMLRGPGIKRNAQFTKSVRNIDIIPTAMYALGLQPNEEWSGKIMTEAFN